MRYKFVTDLISYGLNYYDYTIEISHSNNYMYKYLNVTYIYIYTI